MNRILQTTMDFTVQPSETFIHAIKVIFCHVISSPSKETRVRIRLPENTLLIHHIRQNCENVAENIIAIEITNFENNNSGSLVDIFLLKKESEIFID